MPNRIFKLRAVQLDLARQMESLDFIRSFIDFASENGFNAVVLYLEGRVRTKSFPYPAKSQSYSPDEMRGIVSHAKKKGIEIIPATQALSHSELFLNYDETKKLSELRENGMTGRWASQMAFHETFCPSLPETRTFLTNYFTELSEIFPSKYFNAGLDEAWHIGICKLCRKHPGGQEGIFTEHIKWLHSLLVDKLGKQMMLWDDMFQHYLGTLMEIPKDIVLCCWHYDAPTDELRWHFGERHRVDKLDEFSKLGFECCIAPADSTFINIDTFTEYAKGKPCLGGIFTMWEKSLHFYNESYPLIAFAGRLWNGASPESAFRKGVESVFGVKDEIFANALKTAKNIPIYYWPYEVKPEKLLRGHLNYEQNLVGSVSETLFDVLAAYMEKINNETGRLSMENIILKLEYAQIFVKLRKTVPLFYDPKRRPSSADLENLKKLAVEIRDYSRKNVSLWKKLRPGISVEPLENHFKTLAENLLSLPSTAGKGIMNLTLFSTGITQDSEVSVRFAGSQEWEKIFSVRLTPAPGDSLHVRSFQVPGDRTPVALRFETWGYGTQGIAFVEIINGKGRFVPDAITSVKGKVAEPENVLSDSIYYAVAGENYTRENFNSHQSCSNKKRHGFEISLKNIS